MGSKAKAGNYFGKRFEANGDFDTTIDRLKSLYYTSTSGSRVTHAYHTPTRTHTTQASCITMTFTNDFHDLPVLFKSGGPGNSLG